MTVADVRMKEDVLVRSEIAEKGCLDPIVDVLQRIGDRQMVGSRKMAISG